MGKIESEQRLRQIYKPAKGRAVSKQLDRIEQHGRRFVELSPFVLIATADGTGRTDVSPKGDGPGFVQVLDAHHLAIPDRPGNNRLDTLTNLLARPEIGLIFLIPGVNETFRVNGRAEIRDDESLRARFEVNGKLPATVIVVEVREAYLHCAKALMRSKLWDQAAQIERTALPTLSRMLNDQTNTDAPEEGQAEMEQRYQGELY